MLPKPEVIFSVHFGGDTSLTKPPPCKVHLYEHMMFIYDISATSNGLK